MSEASEMSDWLEDGEDEVSHRGGCNCSKCYHEGML